MTIAPGNKPRVRLYIVGLATYRLMSRDKGWGGPYGQYRRPARWACIECGKKVDGDDSRPWVQPDRITGRFNNPCADNGHAPCSWCGQQLPRLNDGCARAHGWNRCPAKHEGHRVQPQHADIGDKARRAS